MNSLPTLGPSSALSAVPKAATKLRAGGEPAAFARSLGQALQAAPEQASPGPEDAAADAKRGGKTDISFELSNGPPPATEAGPRSPPIDARWPTEGPGAAPSTPPADATGPAASAGLRPQTPAGLPPAARLPEDRPLAPGALPPRLAERAAERVDTGAAKAKWVPDAASGPASAAAPAAPGKTHTPTHPADPTAAGFAANLPFAQAEARPAKATADAAGAAQVLPAPAAAPGPVLDSTAGSLRSAEATLSAPPGSPAFAQELAASVSTFVRDGIEHARLQLHPAELGPVDVRIQIDGQQAQVLLLAELPATREQLEQALPALANGLREAGLTLAGGGVFEQAQQGRDSGGRRDASPPSPAHASMREAVALPAPLRSRGVVDLVA